MVVKKVAAADAKVAPGFEGGEPLTLANSRGLKSALKFFVKIGLFLEFRRIPGKLGDGDGAAGGSTLPPVGGAELLLVGLKCPLSSLTCSGVQLLHKIELFL